MLRPMPTGARETLVQQAVAAALPFFDAASREYAYHRNQEILRSTGGISPTSINPNDAEEARAVPIWREHVDRLDGELLTRAAPIFTRLVMEQLLDRATIADPAAAAHRAASVQIRADGIAAATRHQRSLPTAGGHHHRRPPRKPALPPVP